MKFSAQEEFGLRCLLQIAGQEDGSVLTIPEISRIENLSQYNVAKMLRLLRKADLITSVRGQSGGYKLKRPAHEIVVNDVLVALGGKLYDRKFCARFSGLGSVCAHHSNCSVRSLWETIQSVVENLLTQITLRDLMSNESAMKQQLLILQSGQLAESWAKVPPTRLIQAGSSPEEAR